VILVLPVASGAASAGRSAAITNGPVVKRCAVGLEPNFPGYDPVNHYVYVPNLLSHNVSVLQADCRLVGTIYLGLSSLPFAAAFDPLNHKMYVSDSGLEVVHVISGLTVVANVSSSLLTTVNQLVWDPDASVILVTNGGFGASVVAISGTTVLGSVGTGGYPTGICYDPLYHSVLVVNLVSDNVTLLNASHPLSGSIGNFAVGQSPTSCAYDPANQRDYVTNQLSHNLSVVSGNGTPFGNVTVGGFPEGIAWDPAHAKLYVVNFIHGHVTIVSGLHVVRNIVFSHSEAMGAVYDANTGKMFVTSYGISQVVLLR
jgi:DNA-binding beta-propeller fold protein YncE